MNEQMTVKQLQEQIKNLEENIPVYIACGCNNQRPIYNVVVGDIIERRYEELGDHIGKLVNIGKGLIIG